MKMLVRERTKCVAPFQCSNHSVTQKKITVCTRHTREALFPFSLIKKLRHRGVNSWPRLGEAEPGLEGHIPRPLPAGAGRCAVLLRDGLQKGGGPRLQLTYWLSRLTQVKVHGEISEHRIYQRGEEKGALAGARLSGFGSESVRTPLFLWVPSWKPGTQVQD